MTALPLPVFTRRTGLLLATALAFMLAQPGLVRADEPLPVTAPPPVTTPSAHLTASQPAPARQLTFASQPVTAGQATQPAPFDLKQLTLHQALTLALERNLQFAQTFEQVEQARSLLQGARAVLGPSVSLGASQGNLTTNLRAQGFPPLPGFPTLNGPFNSFDARLRLSQAVFDPIRSHQAAASGRQVEEAEHQRLAIRDQLLIATALAYITAQQTAAALASAQADLTLASELAQLARDQRDNGVATGVDVARAETRVAQDQLALTQARSEQAQALLRLKRLAGLPAGELVQLADGLDYARRPTPTLDEAVTRAMAQRQEIQMQDARVSAAEEAVFAADSEGLPVVAVEAAIGPSGVTPARTVYLTRSVGISVSVPLFTNGLLDAHRDRAKSQLRAARMAQEDTRRQVEEDVHLAMLAVETTAEQVQVAQTTVNLSERLLALARDRFRSGVADNLEVLDALTALTGAQSRRIEANAAYNAARANMYAAMGDSRAFGF